MDGEGTVMMDLLNERLNGLQRLIGYTFKEISLLKRTLLPRAINREVNNERLEFLGDSVLGFIVTDLLYRFEDVKEGELTNQRSKCVSNANLRRIANEKLKLYEYVFCDTKKYKTEDVLEALIGSIYLDGGIEQATKFVKKFCYEDPEIMLVKQVGHIHHPPPLAVNRPLQLLTHHEQLALKYPHIGLLYPQFNIKAPINIKKRKSKLRRRMEAMMQREGRYRPKLDDEIEILDVKQGPTVRNGRTGSNVGGRGRYFSSVSWPTVAKFTSCARSAIQAQHKTRRLLKSRVKLAKKRLFNMKRSKAINESINDLIVLEK